MSITINYLPHLPNGYVATVAQWAYDLGVATACALCPVWPWASHADMHALEPLCKTVQYQHFMVQVVIGLFEHSGQAPPEDHAAVLEPEHEPEPEPEPPTPLYSLWLPLKAAPG